jgi:hypothetical protein
MTRVWYRGHWISLPAFSSFGDCFGKNNQSCSSIQSERSLSVRANMDLFKENHQCKVCGVIFTRPENLQRHYDSTHNKMKIKCPNCNINCTRKDTLNKHLKKCTGNMQYGEGDVDLAEFKWETEGMLADLALSQVGSGIPGFETWDFEKQQQNLPQFTWNGENYTILPGPWRTPFPFKHPFTGVVAGPTGCGKSQLMKDIILNIDRMMDPVPSRMVWYYSEHQPDLEYALAHIVEFKHGLPDMNEFTGEPTLVIIDDLMAEADSDVAKIFTKGSHHRNVSVWFLMQNFFHKGKDIRTITLNAHYIILFKNPRDKQQIGVLARQMFGSDYKYMVEAYQMATEEPHGYLLIDLKQDTDDELRLRTKILPRDQFAHVYRSVKNHKADQITPI